VGEALALGVNVERGVGSIIPIQATPIRIREENGGGPKGYLSMVDATGNIEKILDESRKVAMTGILYCGQELGIDFSQLKAPIHLHLMGASTPKDGPSAGGAIALALASLLSGHPVRRDLAMTGEIDTRGRIKGVGGLCVKLETAYDAGCRTLIIPKENLFGDEGIERLPESLKGELQILTYERWKQEHEPFNYERHILQLVAVDHVIQAADVAFLHEGELAKLVDRFIPNAHAIAETLIPVRSEAGSCVHLIKDPQEMELETVEEPPWEGRRTVFLLKPEVKGDRLTGFPVLERYSETEDLNISSVRLQSIIQDIEDACLQRGFDVCRASLVAPFYLLMESGLTPGSKGIKVFANNYAVQGLKIKNCKPLLNRAYYYLSHLVPAELDDCFFLRKQNGIYAVDLGFIPEKYRLDVRRAETILNACLKRWLNVLEDSIREIQPSEVKCLEASDFVHKTTARCG
jgi:ATP-dependent Lon protease